MTKRENAHRRVLAVGVVAVLLAPLAAGLVPAASAASASGMRWGMNVPAIQPMADMGAKPDFAMTWVGVWNNDDWASVERALLKIRDSGVTPVVQWYYWGDDISPSCVENGCYSTLHGNDKTKAEWDAMSVKLTDLIRTVMQGKETIVVLETEFNKGGIDSLDYAPVFDAYMENQTKTLKSASGVKVIIGFGSWGSDRWTRFPATVAAADFVGYQALRSSVRQTVEQYLGVVTHLVNQASLMNTKFPGKPVFITDTAFSSYPEPEWAEYQRQVIAEMWARVGELQARGVKGLMYRSLTDVNMDTANHHGEAERWWGLRHQDLSPKPALQAWLDGVGAVPPPPPPGVPVPGLIEAESMTATVGGRQTDSKASGGYAWNLWANGDLSTYVEAAEEREYDVVVRARGSSAAGGWPLLRAYVGSDVVAEITVDYGSYLEYRFRANLTPTSTLMRVAYVNDYRTSTEDRNVIVDYFSIDVPKPPPPGAPVPGSFEAEAMNASVGGRQTDSKASGGYAWNLWSNGDLRTRIQASEAGAFDFVVRARGSSAGGGWPILTAYVGDARVAEFTVGSTGYQDYAFRVELSTSPLDVRLEYANDYRTSTEDRNVIVDVMKVAAAPKPNSPPTASFSWSADGLAASFDASGSSDADGDALSYAWDFGDGTKGSGATASRTYAADGSYTVTLTVTDARGASATQTQSVAVARPNAAPTAAFSWSASGLDASFDASGSSDADGDALTFTWDFGDGSTGVGAAATHTYASEGAYAVVLTVTDARGASATQTQEITVTRPNAAPTAEFSWSADGLTAAFDASASADPDGDALAYAWDLGDGSIAPGAILSHVYAADGTYTVTLTVTDPLGASASYAQAVAVARGNDAPTAAFSWSTDGLVVRVDASASSDPEGDAITFAWDFGDGNVTAGAIAEHAFATAGSYAVTLTVTDDRGAANSASATVNVTRAPVAAFTFAADNLTVSFDATGSSDPDGDALAFAWDFGDGGSGEGATPAHAYATGGTYLVALTVTDAHGAATSLTQLVSVNRAPVAAFTSTSVDLRVAFDASTSGDPDGDALAYAWDFGDGATYRCDAAGCAASGPGATTGDGRAVEHEFPTGGTYRVTLTVTDEHGASYALAHGVTLNRAPSASYVYSATHLRAAFDASASADADGDALAFAWDFGDGGAGEGAAAEHEYATGGAYAVTLTVTDARGASSSMTGTVVVNRPPTASFTSAASGLDATFDASASADPDGDGLAYAWDFGDGSTGSGVSASHAYAAEGAYTVTLTVTDARGASATQAQAITVARPNAAPTAAFSWSAQGLNATFDASASADADGDALAYAWDFGDGTTGVGVAPTHAYTASGTYTVTLTVSDDHAVATASASISVTAPAPPPPASGPAELEGEAFTYKSTGGRAKDSAASGGYAWNIWSNGFIRDTFTQAEAGEYAVTVRARGTSASGEWPIMELRLDGSAVGRVRVPSSSWGDYVFAVPFAAGESRAISVAFVNDHRTSTEDRNLHVDVVRVAPLSPLTVEAEAFAVKTTGGRLSDKAASGGYYWNVWSNGHLETTLDASASGKYSLDVLARGRTAAGVAPRMVVSVDGAVVLEADVAPDGFAPHRVVLDLAAGKHVVRVAYVNDYRTSTEDRNLHVDHVVFRPARS